MFDPFCMSAYLALRYVPRADCAWRPGVVPELPHLVSSALTPVASSETILSALRSQLQQIDPAHTGILLSGGIDSAILAALLPRGTRAYTIRFVAPGAVDETERANMFAAQAGLVQRVVEVSWRDYLTRTDALMCRKHSPLHAIEVALNKAAGVAVSDGLDRLIVGNGADSTFGGMDKLLSRDWSFDEFVARYTFVDPERVLRESRSLRDVFEPYRRGQAIDVVGFLKHVHGIGIVQAFDNAINAADCEILAPYESLRLAAPLDLARIRAGEPKYLLSALFRKLFPVLEPPTKIPFARPMDQWLSNWSGPKRAEFRDDIALASLSGDQKWLLYCLDRFLEIMDDRSP